MNHIHSKNDALFHRTRRGSLINSDTQEIDNSCVPDQEKMGILLEPGRYLYICFEECLIELRAKCEQIEVIPKAFASPRFHLYLRFIQPGIQSLQTDPEVVVNTGQGQKRISGPKHDICFGFDVPGLDPDPLHPEVIYPEVLVGCVRLLRKSMIGLY